MALSTQQQLIEQLTHAKRVLLLTHQHPSIDQVASLTAMAGLLNKLHIANDVVIPHFSTSERPSFLPTEPTINGRLGAVRAFHMLVNVQETPLSELSYDLKNGVLDITLIPKQGAWSPQDVTFKYGQDRYDLVIVIGCTDVSRLGSLSKEQNDFLYRQPVINIDYHATNENWGQINLVQSTAISCTEVIYHWLNEWNPQLIDAHMATGLLSGMIETSHSFRSNRVTPQTLDAAARLVELGADRQKIVHELWRQRSVSTLKLWGKALSRLQHDADLQFTLTSITEQDLHETSSKVSDVDGLASELLSFTSDTKLAFIAIQQGQQTNVHVFSYGNRDASQVAGLFGGHGQQDRAEWSMNTQQLPADLFNYCRDRILQKPAPVAQPAPVESAPTIQFPVNPINA